MSDNAVDSSRVPVTVNLTPPAREIIKLLKEHSGLPQQAAVERILQWFANQPETVRHAILSPTGDPAAELVRMRRAEIAAAGDLLESGGVTTVPEALKVIRLMTERIEQIHETERGAMLQEAQMRRAQSKRKG